MEALEEILRDLERGTKIFFCLLRVVRTSFFFLTICKINEFISLSYRAFTSISCVSYSCFTHLSLTPVHYQASPLPPLSALLLLFISVLDVPFWWPSMPLSVGKGLEMALSGWYQLLGCCCHLLVGSFLEKILLLVWKHLTSPSTFLSLH